MLNRGAVDRILWKSVLCVVTWCVVITTLQHAYPQYLSTAPQLSITQKILGTFPEDGKGRRLDRRKQLEVEDYIISKWEQEDVETLYNLLNKNNE
jgi:hypothetical protein